MIRRATLKRAMLALAVLWPAAYLAGALLSPPDPFTQLLYVGPLLVAAVPVALWYGLYGGREGS